MISVIYLFYTPYGLEHFNCFIESYSKFSSNVKHQLVIALKGCNHNDEIVTHCKKIFDDKKIEPQFLFVPNLGFDINAYQYILNQINTTYAICFNTKSIILHENWLDIYQEHCNEKLGIIAATASFQSHLSTVLNEENWFYNFEKKLTENLKKYLLLLKANTVWRFYYKKFPNPHVRTNAFLVNKAIFLSLDIKNPLTSKRKAYVLESGFYSITNQLLQKKLIVGIIDKNGKFFDVKNANLSNTFWKNNQEDLLIEDNQTALYRNASNSEKKELSLLAWGN